MTNFDQIIDRTRTASVKYDGRKAVFGTTDVTPLWVADMDFATPTVVTKALVERANHPVYGYSLYPEDLFIALQNWFQQRHNWTIDRTSIVMCPGVMPSIHAAIMALSQPGDKVIVQPPVYPPFFSAVTETQRELVLNPLKFEGDGYVIDFEHLEQCGASGAKLLLLCSPHNPVGRVWQWQELEDILNIARRHQLTIISDEIHADLIYPDHQHMPLAILADDVAIVTAVSPSKTFNMPGLGLSCLIVNEPHYTAINNVFKSWHINAGNPFSITAFEAAYRGGEQWLNDLMLYLDETRIQVIAFFKQSISKIKVIEPEGTYLLWLDCHELRLNDDEIKQFFIKKAKVGFNCGLSFGEAGSGFMRMNIASPRSVILNACQKIARAYAQL